MMRAWIDTTEESVSRVLSATSVMPDSSYASAILERITCVRRSIASTTTAGEGGRGTFDAKLRLEKERAGVRVKADRARVVAGSTSESSL